MKAAKPIIIFALAFCLLVLVFEFIYIQTGLWKVGVQMGDYEIVLIASFVSSFLPFLRPILIMLVDSVGTSIMGAEE